MADSVYRFRVRGTPDLELAYEIVQPDLTTATFLSCAGRQHNGPAFRLAVTSRSIRGVTALPPIFPDSRTAETEAAFCADDPGVA